MRDEANGAGLLDFETTLWTAPTTKRGAFGYAYESFFGEFADAGGTKAGEFHTLRAIVQLLVEII